MNFTEVCGASGLSYYIILDIEYELTKVCGATGVRAQLLHHLRYRI